MKLVYLATDPLTVFRLMDGQLAYMREQGFDVTVISAPGTLLQRAAEREGVRALAVPMRRELSPIDDLKALSHLTLLLREVSPTIVNAGTPKAGLLGVLAARLAKVPHIVYLLRGLRFEGARGTKRLLLAATEHVAGGLAHRIFANSGSLKDRFVSLGCASAQKIWVPGSGSSNGVEVSRFEVTPQRRAWAAVERAKLGVGDDSFVVGFVGRFARDKGMAELVQAFQLAAAEEPRLRLLLVGDHDHTDPVPFEVRSFIANDRRVVTTGFVDEPARYYALFDALVFPSYREGFPNVLLEAAAAGVPAIAFRATGTVDAVLDAQTGTLVDQGDARGLAVTILRYARDPRLALAHGVAAQARAAAEFSRERIWREIAAEYRRMAAGT